MIGFLGGTFDPVHRGHIHAARVAREELALEAVHLVLAGQPSHRRPPGATACERWAMLRLALESEPHLVADDRELRREGPSYTVWTLTELRAELGPERPIVWLLGWDAFCRLDSWYEWRRLPELAHLVVLKRPGAAPQATEPVRQFSRHARTEERAALRRAPAGALLVLEADMLPISASEIRARLRRGAPVADLLPASVWSYIIDHQLYGGPSH